MNKLCFFFLLCVSFHFQNCHELEKMDLEECVQVKTAGFPHRWSEALTPALTLVCAPDHRWNTHTVVHPLSPFTSPGECPSLKHIRFLLFFFWRATTCDRAAAELVPLRADHGRRHQAPRQRPLRPRSPGGDRVGQLSPHHGRFPGAPEELPQSGSHRALRLPADYPRRHQETKGESWGSNGSEEATVWFTRLVS